MSLPAGWNPNEMSFGGIEKIKHITGIPDRQSFGNTQNHYSESLWSRFNFGVENIGNWIAGHVDKMLGIIPKIVFVALVIISVTCVILVWVEDGFFWAILATVLSAIASLIVYYLGGVIVQCGVAFIILCLRYIFWQGWTLLLTLVVGLSIGGYVLINNSGMDFLRPGRITTETVQSATELYQCTASSLNIRTSPNTNSTVIGTIKRNQNVEVYEIKDGFARISYNGQTGYVSTKYLRKN